MKRYRRFLIVQSIGMTLALPACGGGGGERIARISPAPSAPFVPGSPAPPLIPPTAEPPCNPVWDYC